MNSDLLKMMESEQNAKIQESSKMLAEKQLQIDQLNSQIANLYEML